STSMSNLGFIDINKAPFKVFIFSMSSLKGAFQFAGERSIDEQALKTISNDYQYSGVVNPHHLKKMIGDLPLKEKRKARKAIESFVAETTEKYGV
ncbi:hypothetical protein N2Z78_14055, partial [Staphylococcus aureus]|uniref:hypothetical protein n=2 Tax=Staphylococcus TaxID=1279 RepID=UPI001EF4C05A